MVCAANVQLMTAAPDSLVLAEATLARPHLFSVVPGSR
jgi:hypothetical protein